MTLNLIGAHRCIQAAKSEGIPVIVGGAAWGTTQLRAENLGANLMLRDVGELARHVRGRTLRPSTAGSSILPEEALLLEQPPLDLIQDAVEGWARTRVDGPSSRERGEALQALIWIARHAAAAVACDDPSVITDLLELQIKRAPREIEALRDLYRALGDAMTSVAPLAAALVRGQTNKPGMLSTGMALDLGGPGRASGR